ncbi:MAG: ADP-ribosylglycohydrolase family protein [Planctomycetota bacterium]|nr:ADP-ribosylglycohydrolase family protein [Planctomycetota bacterium]
MMNRRTARVRNALWGMFAGDALAMPAHWYYDLGNLRAQFDGGLRGYVAAPHPHPEAFMVGMSYRPDVRTARRLGRPFDILHEHARFYATTFSDLAIERGEREVAHGNVVARLEDRYHYHHGLAAGENTLGAHLARVLLRTGPDAFLEGFVEHLTTPGRNRDPYTEIYIRRWFENYSCGVPAHACAELQRNVWSIGSHGGLVRPLIVSLLASNTYQALGTAIEHMNLTHRSENNVAALGVLVPLLRDLVDGRDTAEALDDHARRVRPPKVTGEELFARYRAAKGPGNIPPDEMWSLHTELKDEPLDLAALAEQPEEEVVLKQLATACYPEHGLPLLLYFARRYVGDPEAALLANANAGGDNVHRNMVLGLLVGAPSALRDGLADRDALEREIAAFG